VSGPTLSALRVPAADRLRALEESAKRLALRSFAFGERYVVVNIPSASVEAVEKGIVERRFLAVVGKTDRASPEVETRITNVNLNPNWTVPASIIRKDIIPKMQKDPGYLAKARIRIFGASGNEVDPKLIDWKSDRATAFTLRQEAGTGNALGQVRIDMPNREAVYMHDTPSKRLFARDDRFHSSGCVRVENVRDLAAWVLEGAPGWDRAALDAAIATGARKDIRPAAPVPVIWTYLTGYVTPDGQVHFRPDIYRRDAGEVLTAKAERPVQKAKAAPMPLTLDTDALDAMVSGSAGPYRAASAPVQRIDP
jgi:murein L,D-transpeptidase YcbB/YkuD